MRKLCDCFVDISEIVDHHCLDIVVRLLLVVEFLTITV